MSNCTIPKGMSRRRAKFSMPWRRNRGAMPIKNHLDLDEGAGWLCAEFMRKPQQCRHPTTDVVGVTSPFHLLTPQKANRRRKLVQSPACNSCYFCSEGEKNCWTLLKAG